MMFKEIISHENKANLGLVLLIIASVFSVGYHHFDEHFQILEFAGLHLGLTEPSNLPWEFHQQMRPTLQPVLVILLHKFISLFTTPNPFFIAWLLRFSTAIFTFFTLKKLYNTHLNEFNSNATRRWFFLFSFTLWFIVYIGVRFSSETWSGLLFVLGYCTYLNTKSNTLRQSIITGALFGLAFLFRYQVAFLVIGFGCWLLFIEKVQIKVLSGMVLGGLTVVALGICIDSLYYGNFTFSALNYFTQNIVEDKVSGFGVEPWWWYFTKGFERGVPPISLLCLLGAIVTIVGKPKSAIVWSVIPFVLIHTVIGHKELRFLFPMFFFFPILIVQGIAVLESHFKLQFIDRRVTKLIMNAIQVLNSLILAIVLFKPADGQISLYRTLYNEYETPVTLNYIEHNPFKRVLDIHFYKKAELTINSVQTIADIPKTQSQLLVLRNRDITNHPRLGKLVYQTYPEWLLNFNFTDWQSRARGWYVYEIKPN